MCDIAVLFKTLLSRTSVDWICAGWIEKSCREKNEKNIRDENRRNNDT